MGITISCVSCGEISPEPVCLKCQSERIKRLKEISKTNIPSPQYLLETKLSEREILLQRVRELIIKKIKSDFIGNSLLINTPFNSKEIESISEKIKIEMEFRGWSIEIQQNINTTSFIIKPRDDNFSKTFQR